MPWIRNFLTRLAKLNQAAADAPAAVHHVEPENDVFAELVAASSFLDFGGAPAESKLKDTDLNRGLRPW